MSEIYSKSQVRAIDDILLMKTLEHQLKHIKVMKNGFCL